MIVRDLSLADPKGRFLTSPELRIDWGPFALLSNHVDVRSATAQRINGLRLPEFKPVPDTGEPRLPDIDIDVASPQGDRIVFAAAVAGERQESLPSGQIAIATRRAEWSAHASTLGAPATGDTVTTRLNTTSSGWGKTEREGEKRGG